MNSENSRLGFLLTRQNIDTENGIALQFWFYTEQGPILITQAQEKALFFVESSEHEKAFKLCGSLVSEARSLSLKSFSQKDVFAYYFNSLNKHRKAAKLLKEQHIEPLEFDVRTVDRYLMERFITADAYLQPANMPAPPNTPLKAGPLRIISPKHISLDEQALSTTPRFRIISFDIETNFHTNTLLSIAVYGKDIKVCFMLDEKSDTVLGSIPDTYFYHHEKALLSAFLNWIQDYDPDILIGWNCINFDLRTLQQACDRLGLPFSLGRNNQTIEWRTSPNNPNHFFTLIPGRAVLDGIDTLKSATYNFESFALEAVAREVLGKGKLIHDPDDRGEEIIRQFKEDKASLAQYNIEDCKLVWDIFEKLELIDFATERARLTGLPLDKVGGSVMAFENLYLPRLHRLGYVAPNIPSNPVGVGSPGGYVMNSKPGFYQDVLVLDFKSLYPSIIRSFRIDPYGLTEADHLLATPIQNHREHDYDDIHFDHLTYDRAAFAKGFRGAFFKREDNILPELIDTLWQARDQAKRRKQGAMSTAIKIIMNSFYGVMGTPGCRFFDRRLPSSITLRGHQIMTQTSQLIEAKGFDVIYGDTDSLFVRIPENNGRSPNAIGSELAEYINQWWQQHLKNEFELESALELEFENHFTRFLMPTIRGSDKGSKKRYAGLKTNENFNIRAPADNDYSLVFKGLETVRTDWTQLARQFQYELYRRVFLELEYKSYIKDTVEKLKQGALDQQLIFRKRLRRHLNEYQKNIPPHAQAAKKADLYLRSQGKKPRYQHGGWISYIYTINGPEPMEYQPSQIDYDLYIERQIIPIVDGILNFFDTSFDDICSQQMKLI